ncbi:putative RNA binding protein [Aspergillus lucknowensis]|uniref:Uncharacterized protein n=1 Tax=Aspergillus lucknowensis TaxID=176173 RepID=A0ABR4M6P0_9EURO
MEIRTRKVIRRYVSRDSGGACKRPRIYDQGEYYYRRYAQRRGPEERYSPTYRIIETREPLKPRASLNTLWRRDSSPIRSQPFKMCLPFVKRVVEPTRNDYERKPRGRARSPRPFVVDPPEIRYAWPKTERARSLSPEIRYISPRRGSSPRPIEREASVVLQESPRESRPLEQRKGPRPPRERTPVVEREPLRRRQRQQSIEIHQSPERRRERSGSSGRRQVRFSDDIDYVEQRSRGRGRYDPRQPESDDDDSIREHIRRRVFGRRVPGDIDDGPRHRRLSPQRPTYRGSNPSWLHRAEASIRSSPAYGRGRFRPRIIQDGDRDISEAGNRIYTEARRKRSQERALYDCISNSSSRWRRRFDDIRDFSSEDESYLRGSRPYGRRWR